MFNKFIILILVISTHLTLAIPIGSEFTYQGELIANNNPANGSYDFTFRLYDAATGAGQIGSDLIMTGVTVSNGVFNIPLDFGVSAFTGNERWLDISVKWPANTSYQQLSPRQLITSAPYAIHSQFVGINAVTTNEILDFTVSSQDLRSGAVTNSKLATNAVTSSKIASNAVTSSKIANNAVDANKLAAFSVNRSEISGTEVMLYKISLGCRGFDLMSNVSTCQTISCLSSPTTLYYTCSGTCGVSVRPTCTNTAIGYLLSPQIGQ